MDKIIDGKKLALEHQEKLKEELAGLNTKPKVISILMGNDAPSVLYTNIKQKKAQELGIDFEALHFEFPPVKWEAICSKIEELNHDENVDGIMIQLPVPDEFLKGHKVEELLSLISPQKDIDGLNYISRPEAYIPAAVKAVISILEDEGIKVEGKNIVVVGNSDLIGKPVAQELIKMGGKVGVADSKTANLQGLTLEADIIISAAGVPGLITGDMVKSGVVIIDVGTTKVEGKLKGDIDFNSVYPKAAKITPVPGGVGPMTVISLMENIVEVVKRRVEM